MVGSVQSSMCSMKSTGTGAGAGAGEGAGAGAVCSVQRAVYSVYFAVCRR